jgi:hypothetical protein
MYISFACPPVEPLPAWSVVLSGFFDAEESRYVFSCGSCWEEAAPLLWNKLFRPGLLSADGCSGAIGGGRGRRERSRSGSVANVASVSDLGISRLGAGCSEILPLLVRLLAALAEGWFLDLWLAGGWSCASSSSPVGEMCRATVRGVWGVSPADILSPSRSTTAPFKACMR